MNWSLGYILGLIDEKGIDVAHTMWLRNCQSVKATWVSRMGQNFDD